MTATEVLDAFAPGRPPENPPKRTEEQPPATVAEENEDKYLDIHGHKVSTQAKSGHWLVLKTLAKECNFSRAMEALSDPCLDTNNVQRAREILDLMMVRRDAIEPLVRNSPEWAEHVAKKSQNLETVPGEDSKAINGRERRVSDGKWLGNIPEIISVCCGSYRHAWHLAHNGEVPNIKSARNHIKINRAGLVVRSFPRRAKKGEPVYVMLFPQEHFLTVERLIKAAFGVDESQDPKKDQK